MNLLSITEDEKRHYVLIKDFNKFMYNQSKHKERKHFCMYCLQCFSSESILAKHTNNCLTINGKQAIKMPKKDDSVLKFNNFHKQQPVTFVIYADFEAITKNRQGCRPNDDKSYTKAYQTHVAMDIKSYAAIKINIVNQFKRIGLKMPFTNSWKRCLKRLNTVKISLRKGSSNH